MFRVDSISSNTIQFNQYLSGGISTLVVINKGLLATLFWVGDYFSTIVLVAVVLVTTALTIMGS